LCRKSLIHWIFCHLRRITWRNLQIWWASSNCTQLVKQACIKYNLLQGKFMTSGPVCSMKLILLTTTKPLAKSSTEDSERNSLSTRRIEMIRLMQTNQV
jgi:hypothetical protein